MCFIDKWEAAWSAAYLNANCLLEIFISANAVLQQKFQISGKWIVYALVYKKNDVICKLSKAMVLYKNY